MGFHTSVRVQRGSNGSCGCCAQPFLTCISTQTWPHAPIRRGLSGPSAGTCKRLAKVRGVILFRFFGGAPFTRYPRGMSNLPMREGPSCVTGGAGFIGSFLARALAVAPDGDTRIVDDLSSGSRANIASAPGPIKLFEGSILNSALLDSAFEGVQTVYHHAALVSVTESIQNPEKYHEVNVEGTRCVLEAAKKAGVERVIYAGSCSAYGDLPGLPKTEEHPVEPTSPYAASKLAGEELVASYATEDGLDTVRLRYFNVFGPGQPHDSPYAAVVPKFIDALERGEAVTIFGDGEQTRDFVLIQDVFQANMCAAMCRYRFGGTVFNVASGQSRSINDVVKAVGRELGIEPKVVYKPAREGEVRHSVASLAKSKEALTYKPRYTLEDGLECIINPADDD